MMAQFSPATTKSIDVGSMFLIDLSVYDSEPTCNQNDIENNSINASNIGPGSFNFGLNGPKSMFRLNESSLPAYPGPKSIVDHRQDMDYLGNSLDRLASVINRDVDSQGIIGDDGGQSSSVTIVEPQPLPDLKETQSSCSLSDDSYEASSSGTSLSASFTASSEHENEDRGSTTTREDSGVLDLKDLDGQLSNSYDNDRETKLCYHESRLQQKEKPISNDITATNLINRSVHNQQDFKNTVHRSNKPTDSNSSRHHNHHHHHQHHHSQGVRISSKPSMSASLPIQVPARQLKKNLNKMKLNLLNKNSEYELDETGPQVIETNKRRGSSRAYHNEASAFSGEDVDEFLEQEYNDNHHNHYPIDEFDEEHVRADDNPMKLFASIQALARSLHEDAELFGSLPPKRLLESPIRSIALV